MHKTTKESFHFQKFTKNPDYEAGLKFIPFRSCLRYDNSDKKSRKNVAQTRSHTKLQRSKKSDKLSNKVTSILKRQTRSHSTLQPKIYDDEKLVKTLPKWNTTLGYYEVDNDTGEIVAVGEYMTDELKASNARKIKALDAFSAHFQPLYKKKAVSIMFHTFTQANNARIDFKKMLDVVRSRYKRKGYKVRGDIWTCEISYENNASGHWHYHLAVAVDRVNLRGKKLPAWMKFNEVWGRRTGVEFVKKNVRHYMAKYFAKHNARIVGIRSYGKSRKFN